jgi:(S)-2-hydroxyglutarate dehydrogenase
MVNCAGLQSDRIAQQTHPNLSVRITPFRGEYYVLKPESRGLVRNLIYRVPNPSFPFLGVHFTRMINGEVECGPNAVFAFAREGYGRFDFNFKDTIEALTWPGFQKVVRKYWKAGLSEFYRSVSKKAFVNELQRLIPDIEGDDLIPGGSGVRAQACDRDGVLLDDFYILSSKSIIHVCNAPSPAATSSLAIGQTIAERILPLLS